LAGQAQCLGPPIFLLSYPMRLENYHVAFVAGEGCEEPELTEPVRVLKEAGAEVDIIAPCKYMIEAVRRHPDGEMEPVLVAADKKLDEVQPEAYDAVMLPGCALASDRFRVEAEVQDFLRVMHTAGKPLVCMPVPSVEAHRAKEPEPVTTNAVWSMIKETVSRWSEVNAGRLAAALAYYTVFSMAPLLVFVLAIAGKVFGDAAAQGQIRWQIQNLVGPAGAEIVELLLRGARNSSSGAVATAVGLLALLFGASGVFVELRDSLNYVWGVKQPSGGIVKGLLLSRMFSFAMVLAIGFLLLVSLVLSAFVAAASKYFGSFLSLSPAVLQLLTLLISFVVTTLLFALIYKVVPDLPVAWGDVWIGAAVTALLFSVGKFLSISDRRA